MNFIRSFLFVPGNQRNKIEKAKTLNADVVVLDLEDSVPYENKEEARRIVSESIKNTDWGKIKLCVRINSLFSKFWLQDLIEITKQGPEIIMIPKISKKTDIKIVEKVLENIEENYNINKAKIIPIIENVEGFKNLYSIATASDRIIGITFGIADFCADLGCEENEHLLNLLRFNIALAASYAKKQAIDTAYLDIKNLDMLEKEARIAKSLGFIGKICIHPSQVEIVNKVFTPSNEEIENAKRILEVYNESIKKGIGAVSLDGKMIDEAVLKKAKRILGMI